MNKKRLAEMFKEMEAETRRSMIAKLYFKNRLTVDQIKSYYKSFDKDIIEKDIEYLKEKYKLEIDNERN